MCLKNAQTKRSHTLQRSISISIGNRHTILTLTHTHTHTEKHSWAYIKTKTMAIRAAKTVNICYDVIRTKCWVKCVKNVCLQLMILPLKQKKKIIGQFSLGVGLQAFLIDSHRISIRSVWCNLKVWLELNWSVTFIWLMNADWISHRILFFSCFDHSMHQKLIQFNIISIDTSRRSKQFKVIGICVRSM